MRSASRSTAMRLSSSTRCAECCCATGIVPGIAARCASPAIFLRSTSAGNQSSSAGSDREVRALLNVCRHRGSRVCPERAGHARGGVFVCPYHAWTYELDGSLRAARHMPADFDRGEVWPEGGPRPGHRRADLRVLAETPLGLEHVEEALAGSARIYGWPTARVAHRETYPVNANWKLAVENYMECYHCGPAHGSTRATTCWPGRRRRTVRPTRACGSGRWRWGWRFRKSITGA